MGLLTKPADLLKRFWEVDFCRGIAVCLMIVSNTVTDLQFFASYSGSPEFWFWFSRATASLFLLLVGVSLTLSYSRGVKQGNANFSKYAKRGAWIFMGGLVITAVTVAFISRDAVLFGVLHLIGVSVVLAYFFVRRKTLSLLAGAAIIAAGVALQGMRFGFSQLFWLGLQPAGYRSVDFFPLLPWFGVVLVGVFLGSVLYAKGKRKFALPMRENGATRAVSFLGRHSLVIYLLHQPVILALLAAAGVIALPV